MKTMEDQMICDGLHLDYCRVVQFSKRKSLKCQKCSAGFSTKSLRRHIVEFYEGKKQIYRILCPVCLYEKEKGM